MAKPIQSQPKIPHKAPERPKPQPKEDIFGKKGSISGKKFIRGIKGGSGKIPRSAKSYTWRERESLAKETVKGQGSLFTRREARQQLKELGREKFKAKTGEERLKIDREIRYLKEKFKGF